MYIISISFKIGIQDLKDFYSYQIKQNRFAKILKALFFILFIGEILLSIFYRKTFSYVLLAYIILALFIFLIPKVIIFYRSKKNMEIESNYKEVIAYKFNENGFYATGKGFSTELKWTEVHKVVELHHTFIIYINKDIAQIIPKRAFKEEQGIQFREILNSKMGLNHGS